jgi:hypothetical protein
MKRFLPFFAVCALLLPVLQSARSADLSINFFYDSLNGGNWYEVSDYGYVWQPDVATDTNWRPYTDGYWAYTDQGWTWVSYEDFGWATYHYGRWARLSDYGWVWVPGTEWAPAWVSWRTGGDYIGWAPLPPAGGGEVVYEGRPITGHVDVEFGIGPAYYNFIDLQYIGEPVLRDRILPYDRNVTVINNTVNVTNITYNNSVVYNYGPDYATVSRYSVRPIQRLKLERQSGDAAQAVRNGNVTKVQGNTLVVAAPQRLQKAAGAQVAPKQVKAKIEQPKVEKGWANTEPNQKAKLEQQFKAENAKNVPKPNIQPKKENAAANARVNEPAVAASPGERAGKGKRKGEKVEAAPTTAPAVAASPNPVEQRGKGAKNKNRAEQGQAPPVASPAVENRPANAEERNARPNKANKRQEASEQGNPPGIERNEARSIPENANPIEPKEHKNQRANRHNEQPAPPEPQREGQQRRHEKAENVPGPHQPAAGPATGAARPPREAVQANQQQPQQRAAEGGEQKRKGKGKKDEGESTPPPQ